MTARTSLGRSLSRTSCIFCLIALLSLTAAAGWTAETATSSKASSVTDVDLSPMRWTDREALEEVNAYFETDKALAEGESGAISGTTGPAAVRAGLEALRQGGTAADAVITTALTQIALAGGSWVSYAGIFNLVYFEAETGKVWNVNGGFDTVRGETEPLTIPRSTTIGAEAEPSGRTALVPGFFGGVGETHERFGRLPWSSLFEPAIHYAERGVPVGAIHAGMFDMRKDALSRLPETRQIFTNDEGLFLEEGDLLVQPQLAATLRAVATNGVSHIYRGDWAKRMVAAVQRDGGKLSLEDLSSYEALVTEPVHTTYNGFDVYGHGLPAQGGVHVAEVLNLAEAADLRSMGHYAESPEAFFWMNQMTNLMAIVFLPEASREFMFGEVDATLAGRTSKANAAKLWQRMKSGRLPLTKVPTPVDPKHSDAIVAVDGFGNVAAVVHTINTAAWGDTAIFVDGISIPDSAAFQQALIAETGPGNRLPDPTAPVIVLKDGKPVSAFASIGAGLHQKTMSVLLNHLDWKMDIKAAIDAPSPHLPAFGATGMPTQQVIDGDFEPALLEAARNLGLPTNVAPAGIESRAPRGYVVGVSLDQKGTRRAAATTVLNGLALAH